MRWILKEMRNLKKFFFFLFLLRLENKGINGFLPNLAVEIRRSIQLIFICCKKNKNQFPRSVSYISVTIFSIIIHDNDPKLKWPINVKRPK